MVPSWTETLLWAGVQVVGRTRFCVHPVEEVSAIPIVGGTKDWSLRKVRALEPDLLLLDREENPRFMAEEGLPFWASHIHGVESLPEALTDLSKRLKSSRLFELGERWRTVLDAPIREGDSLELPGILEWGRRPTGSVKSIVYVIWRDPWMAVGPSTFIASVLAKLGLRVYPFEENYPQFQMESLGAETLLLFSSEPYPFLRKREGLEELGRPYAFVDGECFSWFGVRSLKFLEKALSMV